MHATQELKSQLSTLPIAERAELAQYFIESLEDIADPDAESAWDEELARREEEIQSGAVSGEPAASVFERIRVALAPDLERSGCQSGKADESACSNRSGR